MGTEGCLRSNRSILLCEVRCGPQGPRCAATALAEPRRAGNGLACDGAPRLAFLLRRLAFGPGGAL